MNKKGFSLLEVVLVIIILGILVSMTIIKYQKTVAHTELQKTSDCLYSELRGIRAITFKMDAITVTTFSAKACSVYVDTSGDNIIQSNELYKVIPIPQNVSIGVPPNGPIKAPIESITWNSTSGICGLWETQGMVINPDPSGSTNNGAICLKSTRVPDVAYCITMDNQITLELYKGNKTTWIIPQ